MDKVGFIQVLRRASEEISQQLPRLYVPSPDLAQRQRLRDGKAQINEPMRKESDVRLVCGPAPGSDTLRDRAMCVVWDEHQARYHIHSGKWAVKRDKMVRRRTSQVSSEADRVLVNVRKCKEIIKSMRSKPHVFRGNESDLSGKRK